MAELLFQRLVVAHHHHEDHVGIVEQQLFDAETGAQPVGGRHGVFPAEHRQHATGVGKVGFGPETGGLREYGGETRRGILSGLRDDPVHAVRDLPGGRAPGGIGIVQPAEQVGQRFKVPVVVVFDRKCRNFHGREQFAQPQVAVELVDQHHEIGAQFQHLFGVQGAECADGGQAARRFRQRAFGLDFRNRDRRASGAVPDRHQRTVADHYPFRMFRQGDFEAVRLAVTDAFRRFRHDARRCGVNRTQGEEKTEKGQESHFDSISQHLAISSSRRVATG